MLMEHRSVSPASSLASLPSDDVSDFSDSDFDIISSSDSTRSHDEEAHQVAAGDYSDDETDHSIDHALLLDRESYGLIDPEGRSQNRAVPTDALNHDELGSIPDDATGALSDEDANVIDALSHSLDRSTDSIGNSATPISASVANVHFITSPSVARRGSYNVSRSRILSEHTSSPSSSVLKLAFPDPLSSSDNSISSPSGDTEDTGGPETPIADNRAEEPFVRESLPVQSFDLAIAPVEADSAPEPEPLKEEKKLVVNDIDEKSPAEDAVVQDMAQVIHRAAHPFEAFDDYVGRMSKHFASTIAGNRWSASVIVSILALLIGGVTYFTAPVPLTPTPSFITPSSTVWGQLVNKSSLVAQPPSPALASPAAGTSTGSFKDASLSLFAPWALAPSSMQHDSADMSPVPAPRGIKRKRVSGSSTKPVTPTCESSAAETSAQGWLNSLKPVTIDAAQPTLTIDDAPQSRKHGTSAPKSITPTGSSSQGAASTSTGQIITLPDPHMLVTALMEYISPTLDVLYDALSEDAAALLRALDELLSAINVHTRTAATMIARTHREVSYRHTRAKQNARKLRAKGAKALDEFKQTMSVAAKGKGREALKEVANRAKNEVMVAAESMREGLRQHLRVRKSKKPRFYSSMYFGSSGGDRSAQSPRKPKKATKAAKSKAAREQTSIEAEGEGFLSNKLWSRAKASRGCATCGARRRRGVL